MGCWRRNKRLIQDFEIHGNGWRLQSVVSTRRLSLPQVAHRDVLPFHSKEEVHLLSFPPPPPQALCSNISEYQESLFAGMPTPGIPELSFLL